MNKVIYLVLLLLLGSLGKASGQACLPCFSTGYNFTAQWQIDDFHTMYPNCTEISGDVIINGNNISNLNGLIVLTSIHSLDIIDNPHLKSLAGLDSLHSIPSSLYIWSNDSLTDISALDNLTSLGGLSLENNPGILSLPSLYNLTFLDGLVIDNNDGLINLSGLDSITSLGGLGISHNDALINLSGLENVTSLDGDLTIEGNNALADIYALGNIPSIEGDLAILYTPALENLSGLNNVNTIDGNVDIKYNTALTDLTGLNNLVTIDGSLAIHDNDDLINLTGLNNLVYIYGWVKIDQNDQLTSLTGLESLIYIRGYLDIIYNTQLLSLSGLDNLEEIDGYLDIASCHKLVGLTALSNLTSIWGNLSITNNSHLESLSGLDNIEEGSMGDLTITGNDSLNKCAVQSICDHLSTSFFNIVISDNKSGCNSIEEVDSACAFLSADHILQTLHCSIYPNPSYTTITIETQFTGQLSILDLHGQSIFTRQVTEAKTVVDISTLSSGVYMVRVVGEKGVQVGKLVKQ